MAQSNRDVALITGAAGAMGAACAARLANRADLILTDLETEGLERVVASWPDAPGKPPSLVAADLLRSEDLRDLREMARSHGGIRWLVHTAGLSPAMADWAQVLKVDLTGTAALLDELGEEIHAGGAAVCFASIAGHMGTDDPDVDAVLDAPQEGDLAERLCAALGAAPDSGIAYLYAKRGVIRLCEKLAAPWGVRGRRIVSLSPGLMDTSMGRLELEKTLQKETMIDLTPVRRPPRTGQSRLPGHLDDIAEAVSFLCSDAASFVSGCDLRVDGGLIAALRA